MLTLVVIILVHGKLDNGKHCRRNVLSTLLVFATVHEEGTQVPSLGIIETERLQVPLVGVVVLATMSTFIVATIMSMSVSYQSTRCVFS